MKEISKKLGDNLKKIRLKKGMTQGDVHRKTGMDRAYVSGLEKGERNPTIANVQKLAEALGITPDLLLK